MKHNYFTIMLTMGCRGISGLAPGSPPARPFPPTLVSVAWLFSHILILLFSGHNYICQIAFFSPFLNILYRSVAIIPDWLSLTQQQVCPRAKWSWGNKLLAASHRNHPGAQFCHYQNHTNLSCQYSWILHSIADFKNSDLCRLSNSCLGCNNA